MDLYSLIRCIQITTNRFTHKCACFQSHSDIFLSLQHIMKYVKTNGKMLIVDRIKKNFLPCAYGWDAKYWGIILTKN